MNMKVIVLYHPESEHARAVLTFQGDFERQTPNKVDLLSLETVEGADMAKLYGITTYPAVIVRTDEGALLKLWEGEQMPLIGEVDSYLV